LQLFADLLLPPGWADDHAIGLQLLFVVLKIAHADRWRPEKAVPARRVPCRHSSDLNLQRLATEHSNHPTNGPDEPRPAEPRPRHGARPRQVVHRARQDGSQYLLRRAARLDLLRCEVLPFRRLHEIEGADMNALLLREAQGRSRRRADSIIGHGLRWSGNLE